MTDKIDRMYDHFDKGVSGLIVHAKAASINAQTDCIYPESFMVSILVTGANEVNSVLANMELNLDKCLTIFKKELIKKRSNNEIKGPIACEDLKISKQVVDICKVANEIRKDILSDEDGMTGIRHVFIALLRTCKSIKDIFEKEGIVEEKFIESFNSFRDKNKDGDTRPKEAVEAGHRRQSRSQCPALSAFCTDITQLAKNNKLDPIIAREKEIEQSITILCRRSKNNPILLGSPGVGKTAIVEGIAQRIISGTVPKQLLGCRLYSLSLTSLVAGTKYRGEFEERIQVLIKEIQSATDCILFIDEIHALVGAGSAAGGALDASNILKPFLARNDLRCIGATTLDDFKKYFQKDGALVRRFQQVMVEEPTKEQMHQIINGIKSKFEEYHNCIVSDDAVEAVINLPSRYMPDKNFPDKSIDCLDMACAKHAWKNDGNKSIIVGTDVAIVISEQCQVPLEVILWDDNERITKIEDKLMSRIIGQKNAIVTVCRALKNAYSGIRNPDKPIGSFVFGGQSGTGKTYMAKELANIVFGRESAFIRLDMTEFSEQHSVSKLIGSPPGYVGFQETDVLIDKIKRKPYCIVLLDELEKAHPDVMKLFLQVMSDGIMTDANGNKADFKNVIIIMTGNFGMNESNRASLGFIDNNKKDPFDEAQERLIGYCKEKYGAEFINRVDEFIPFMPLNNSDLRIIAKMRYGEISARLSNRNCKLKFDDGVTDLLLDLSKKDHGKNATVLNRLISKKVEPCISDVLMAMDNDYYIITAYVKDNEFLCKKEKSSK